MAATLEIDLGYPQSTLPSGTAPTIQLYADGSDTLDTTGSGTEATNRTGFYTLSVTGKSGLYYCRVLDGSGSLIGKGWVNMKTAGRCPVCDTKAEARFDGGTIVGAVNDAGATTTSFNTTLTQASDLPTNAFLVFTDGALAGESRKISAYSNTSGAITLATALTSAPANGVGFLILGRSE